LRFADAAHFFSAAMAWLLDILFVLVALMCLLPCAALYLKDMGNRVDEVRQDEERVSQP
jgi:hypothetical protein